MSGKRRYAIVGTGGRHDMYRNAIVEKFAETSELVGLCDIDEGRVRLSASWVKKEHGVDVPTYHSDDFEKMIADTRPDTVIVTTKDCHHDEYLCRAMEAGCDAITEKPMTTDAAKCQRILDTKKKTGRDVRVTFNYRYSPPRTQVKDMLMDGLIGEVLSVDFHWMLNTSHGADYYRRWHRNKVNSGGLMVHKATHHFDLVNWWLGTVPELVYATGHRHFYLPETAERYGLTNRSERCLGCPESEKCRFFMDIKSTGDMQQMYLECEKYAGYIRDKCVFSDEIDIEDSMNVAVDYANGAKMSYSLNSFSPWEGYHIVFNGTKGRLEHKCQESVYVNGDGTVPGALVKEGTWTKVYPHWQPAYGVDLWTGEGGHGGGDDPLLVGIFTDDPPADKYLRAADERSGAWSILVGAAANVSMAEKRPVRINELVPDIGIPDYAPMPTGKDPLDMPKKTESETG